MRSKSKSDEYATSKVLKSCINGARGTKIVAKSGSGSLKLISYLLLIDNGLIEVNSIGSGSIHKTTKKGLDAIKVLDGFQANKEEVYA